jgi:hypothetical protein
MKEHTEYYKKTGRKLQVNVIIVSGCKNRKHLGTHFRCFISSSKMDNRAGSYFNAAHLSTC